MTATPVALITGGSKGLGAGMIDVFLREGYAVATCARSRSAKVDEWEREHPDRFWFTVADVSKEADATSYVKGAVERFGRIDALVNNAGVAREGVIGLFNDDDIDTVVDLNIKGTAYVTRAASRVMLRQRSGSIVNISSVVGISGYRGLSVYGATKAALDGMTRALARELGSRGITVNSIAPGYLRTEMSHGLDEAQLVQIERRTPMGRLGDAEDVSRAALFLVSAENRFVTGQVLVVDGGLTC